jgi:hypothetical protein
MKKFYRGISFFALLLLAISSHAQEFKKGSWQNNILGTWKLDSTISGQKKLSVWIQDQQENARQYLCFNEDHSFIMYTDPDLLVRDSFDIVERQEKRIIYNGVNTMEIYSADKNQLVLFISDPGINKSRRQTRKCYYSRSFASIETPAINGTWSGRNSMGFSIFGDRNSNILDLKKNGSLNIIINNKKDSGTWTFDEKNFAIEMALTSGKFTSYIISKEKIMMQITNPFQPGQLLDFIMDEQLKTYFNTFEIPELNIKPQSHIKGDTIPPAALFKKWQVIKKIQGTDSTNPGKTVSFLFLKDMTFTITINNKKTSGTWHVNTSSGSIIFNSKDGDILSMYKLRNVATDAFTRNDGKGPELILTMILPGEDRVETYVCR